MIKRIIAKMLFADHIEPLLAKLPGNGKKTWRGFIGTLILTGVYVALALTGPEQVAFMTLLESAKELLVSKDISPVADATLIGMAATSIVAAIGAIHKVYKAVTSGEPESEKGNT